jgi:hypothetical protein
MSSIRHHISTVYQMRVFVSTNIFYFSVAVTVLLFYFSIMLPVSSRSVLGDPDTLWHIRTGQWILDHAQVPTVDFYSYTAAGKRWISTEWLAEIFIALSFKIGEWRGVAILSTLACAAIIAIICFYLVQNLRFSIAIGYTALTALAITPHFLARPHLFAYIVASIWVIKLLESYDRGEFRPSIPSFCVLMVLWANLHPSFTFGLALLYVFAGYAFCEKLLRRDYLRCKDDLFAVIAVSLCALLTPYGIFSALLTLQTMNMKYALQHIAEWHSPDFQQSRIQLFLIVGLLMAVTGLGVRLRGPRLIVYGMLLILCLSYARGLTMFYLLTPIILAKPIAECASWCQAAQHIGVETSQTAGSWRAANTSDPVLLYLQKRSKIIPAIVLAVATLATTASWRQIGIGPPESVAPKAALDFVTSAGITGNVFNSYNFGGYLIFKGIPTFIDGRAPPYTDDFLKEYSDAVTLADIKAAFQLLDQYKVTWVLLLPTDPLAKALAESDQWNEVYSDKDSVVLVRSRQL